MRTMIILAACVLCVAVWAAPPIAVTNYFAGTVMTPEDFADAGDTGLSVSNLYVCVPIAAITSTEYTQALVTNDARPLVSAIVESFRVAIAGMASTNRFTSYVITAETRYDTTGTNRTIYRAISEGQTVTVTPSYGGD